MLELSVDQDAPLPGDDLIRDATKQLTRSLVIEAPPAAIWPALVALVRARRQEGCPVLREAKLRAIVLGGLYDHDAGRYVPFDGPRPPHYWHATWALVLTAIDARRTRLQVRSRVAYTSDAVRWTAVWTHPFADFMAREELLRVKRLAEAATAGPSHAR